MRTFGGSFRDPSGFVFEVDGDIVRTVNEGFSEHWNTCISSKFFAKAIENGELVRFQERAEAIEGSWKTLTVEKIPFISYPYEWCFGQLRDAALLTLALQNRALKHGLTLKDASAYNVQFIGASPVFIDLLSFEVMREGAPWEAYRQFCMHFLAPLALVAKVDVRFLALSKLWISGIPLDLAAKLLPKRSRLRLGLFWHLFLHARMENRHNDSKGSAEKARKVKVSSRTIQGIVDSLALSVKKLRLVNTKTEWGDYYNDTNYTSKADKFKAEQVAHFAAGESGKLAVDLGANTGRYSRILAKHFETVVAADIDPLAVEKHYTFLKKEGPKNIVPLIIDLGNPSSGIGWLCRERDSFFERCQADLAVALALIHHLTFTNEIPLPLLVDFFARILRPGGRLLLEFVPKSDSQIQRLLAVRKDVHENYTVDGMLDAFTKRFREVGRADIPESKRTLHFFEKI